MTGEMQPLNKQVAQHMPLAEVFEQMSQEFKISTINTHTKEIGKILARVKSHQKKPSRMLGVEKVSNKIKNTKDGITSGSETAKEQ